MIIEIFNLTNFKIKKSLFKKASEIAYKILKLKMTDKINLIIIGEKRMQNLNKIWRKKDKPTDVLSFNYNEKDFLGEILICPSYVKKNLKYSKYSLKSELVILLTHGILHLVGFDHERSEKEELEMKEMEDKILKKINENEL